MTPHTPIPHSYLGVTTAPRTALEKHQPLPNQQALGATRTRSSALMSKGGMNKGEDLLVCQGMLGQ
jgi:hypothetical protein